MDRNKKGHDFERWVAQQFREHGYPDARRGLQYQQGGAEADVEDVPGWHVECKRQENLNLQAAMEQSVNDCKEGQIPVVVHKKSRKDALITMRFLQFLDWLQELRDCRLYLKVIRDMDRLDASLDTVRRTLDRVIEVIGREEV